MPSITIYPSVSGGNEYYSQYISSRQESDSQYGGFRLVQSSTSSDEVARNILFNLGESIGSRIPENSKLTSIDIHFYYVKSMPQDVGLYFGYGSQQSSTYIPTLPSATSFRKHVLSFSAGQIENFNSITSMRFIFSNSGVLSNEYEGYTSSSQYFERSDRVYRNGYWYREEYYRVPKDKNLVIKNGSSSTYRPYVVLNYSYNPPMSPTSLAPDGGTQNPRTPIRFTWNSLINQQAFRLQYNLNGGTWTTVSKTSANRYYELPAGTITATNGTLNWRVQVSEQSGVYSDYVSASFQLGVLDQSKPQLVYPVSDYLRNVNVLNFRWNFIPNTIEVQEEFELQYRVEGSTWKTVKETTNRENVDIALNISDSKNVEWRLRTRNQFNEWTNWTDTVQFQVIGTPPIPQILEISNTNRPTIKWQSRDQEMFQIEVYKDDELVYDTGKIVGVSDRSYKISKDLENGKYIFKLKVFNIYDVESPTVEYTHIIEPIAIDKPTISLFESKFGILIKSDAENGFVIRNGKEIGKLEKGEFKDFSGVNKKVYNYKIRVYQDDVFADSEIKSARVDFNYHNTLALTSNLKDFVALSYNLDEDVQKSVNLELESEFIQLDGRKYSEVEVGEHEKEVQSFQCFLEKKDELDRLIELIKKKQEVLLRDCRENNVQGFINNLSWEFNLFGYEVSFSIYKTGDFYD